MYVMDRSNNKGRSTYIQAEMQGYEIGVSHFEELHDNTTHKPAKGREIITSIR